jgi:cobalt-zinc-cadmium efflux system outer membrane protein
MRSTTLAICLYVLVATLGVAQSAQEPSSQMEHNTPGMQMQHPAPSESGNPAGPTSSVAAVVDLLHDARQRPEMDLSQFESYALANNPTLKEANLLVQKSAGLAQQAGLLPNPSIGYQGEQIRGGSYGGGEQGAFVQQTFVLGGKLGLRRNVYEQQRISEQIGVQEQRYRILGELRGQFYAALAAQETVKLRECLLRLADNTVETAHQLANVGQADAPDVLQSEVEAEQAKGDYIAAERMFLQQFSVLASVTGKSDLQPAPLKGALETYPAIDADRALDQLIQNNPAIKLAEQNVAIAEAQLKSAKRERVPDLTVHAGVQNNFEPLGGTTNKPVGVQGFATAGITLPLFNRNQGNVIAEEAELRRARSEAVRVKLAIEQTARPIIQDYLSAKEEANRYQAEMVPRASKAYQLYLAKYQEMAAAYPQVLISQRTLFQLQIAYIGVLQQLWKDATALQNFLLSNGLAAPQASGGSGAMINLPTASATGAQ